MRIEFGKVERVGRDTRQHVCDSFNPRSGWHALASDLSGHGSELGFGLPEVRDLRYRFDRLNIGFKSSSNLVLVQPPFQVQAQVQAD